MGYKQQMLSIESRSSIKEAITTLFDHANAIKKENEVEGMKYNKEKQEKKQGYRRGKNTNARRIIQRRTREKMRIGVINQEQ